MNDQFVMSFVSLSIFTKSWDLGVDQGVHTITITNITHLQLLFDLLSPEPGSRSLIFLRTHSQHSQQSHHVCQNSPTSLSQASLSKFKAFHTFIKIVCRSHYQNQNQNPDEYKIEQNQKNLKHFILNGVNGVDTQTLSDKVKINDHDQQHHQ